MFEDEHVMLTCIKHKITVQQYFFMYMLASRDYKLPVKQSVSHQYLNQVEMFDSKVADSLVEREFVDDFNLPGEGFLDAFMLRDKAKDLFADDDMAEQLWNAYPVTFPLYDKQSRFLARTGEDKQVLMGEYLKRIHFSKRKHLFVMEQLEKYKALVIRGEINGYKISDWVRQELWDSVAELEKKGGKFGIDI